MHHISTKFLLLVFASMKIDASFDYTKGCEQLTCRIGEQCVNRKFWCDRPPCPNMIYCSKSRRESLKGPETCDSVVCADGYKCLVRISDCEWNERCKQQTARCVSEREFLESPASCLDVTCGKGYTCFLRETHCFRFPCKLTKTCARNRDVQNWLNKCKKLGCRSEHDCFLRRPTPTCSTPTCTHEPDCLPSPKEESTWSKQCRGWICPPDQECQANFDDNCKNGFDNEEECRIVRSCKKPTPRILNDDDLDFDFFAPRTTLTDLERDIFLEEQRRLLNGLNPTISSNFSTMKTTPILDEIFPTRISMSNKNSNYDTVKAKRVTSVPKMRSTSSGDSTWLTYLKTKAGAEAVQYWIEKAKNNEDYEGFLDWLNTVADLLDAETYRLWLREVEAASIDVPEFQSWISPKNLSIHRTVGSLKVSPQSHLSKTKSRSNEDDTESIVVDTLRSFPGSIGAQAKNLFYSDKSYVFVEPRSGSRNVGSNVDSALDYHRHPFMDKQNDPSISEYEKPIQQHQQRTYPSNFNFNEPNRFNQDPPSEFELGIRTISTRPTALTSPPPPPPIPYLEISQRRNYEQPHRLSPSPTSSPRTQKDFSDTVKNSWKSWQSYYQLNPPPTNLPGFSQHQQQQQQEAFARNSYYFNNYTETVGNSSVNTVTSSQGLRHQDDISQSRMFFPGGRFNSDQNISQVYLSEGDLPLKRVKLDNNLQGSYDNQYRPFDKLQDLPSPAEFQTMAQQFAGLQQSGQLNSNVIKLDPTKQPVSQLVISPAVDTKEPLPNLLIYFPPPLNFFFYYTARNQNGTPDGIPIDAARFSTIQNFGTSTTMNSTSDVKQPVINLNMNSDPPELENRRMNLKNHESRDKPINKNESRDSRDKQRELDYIRKIIKELINYWDEEEEAEENDMNIEKGDDPVSSEFVNLRSSSEKTSNNRNAKTRTNNESNNRSDNKNMKTEPKIHHSVKNSEKGNTDRQQSNVEQRKINSFMKEFEKQNTDKQPTNEKVNDKQKIKESDKETTDRQVTIEQQKIKDFMKEFVKENADKQLNTEQQKIKEFMKNFAKENTDEKLKSEQEKINDSAKENSDEKLNSEQQKMFDLMKDFAKENADGKVNSEQIASSESADEEAEPTFTTFLDWLIKNNIRNSTWPEPKRRRKPPPVYEEPKSTRRSPSILRRHADPSLHIHPINDDSEKNRILVDINKNPELIKALLLKNKTNHRNESEYQVLVDLKDFVGSKDEDHITHRLMDIASKQLHRNVSGKEKMPKILWVFPVYDDDVNVTSEDEIRKQINKKINKLHDVNLPTENKVKVELPKVTTTTSRVTTVQNKKTPTKHNITEVINDDDVESEDSFIEDDDIDDDDDEYEETHDHSDTDDTLE